MAIMRAAQSAGVPCYLIARGDADRGAIYLWVRMPGHRAHLFGPPPPSFDAKPDEGRLQSVFSQEAVGEAEVEAYMQRQREIDPDLWLIEVEDDQGRNFAAE